MLLLDTHLGYLKGNDLFNDALNTFYGIEVEHVVKDHRDS